MRMKWDGMENVSFLKLLKDANVFNRYTELQCGFRSNAAFYCTSSGKKMDAQKKTCQPQYAQKKVTLEVHGCSDMKNTDNQFGTLSETRYIMWPAIEISAFTNAADWKTGQNKTTSWNKLEFTFSLLSHKTQRPARNFKQLILLLIHRKSLQLESLLPKCYTAFNYNFMIDDGKNLRKILWK